MIKVKAQVYDLTDSHAGTGRDGKPYEFFKQSCQINTPPNIPDVPFMYQVKKAADYLTAGLYEFTLMPKAGKYGAIDWLFTDPKRVAAS